MLRDAQVGTQGAHPVLSLEQHLLTFEAKTGKGKPFLVPLSLSVVFLGSDFCFQRHNS
jgi:hypothetical protein